MLQGLRDTNQTEILVSDISGSSHSPGLWVWLYKLLSWVRRCSVTHNPMCTTNADAQVMDQCQTGVTLTDAHIVWPNILYQSHMHLETRAGKNWQDDGTCWSDSDWSIVTTDLLWYASGTDNAYQWNLSLSGGKRDGSWGRVLLLCSKRLKQGPIDAERRLCEQTAGGRERRVNRKNDIVS